MRNIPVKSVLLLAAAVPLASCSSLFGSHSFASKMPEIRPTAIMAEAGSTPATDAGRKELDANRPGAAIEAFQKALATGEPVAPAVNGLGVAYARLGRFDLAQRFFEQAAAADPANPRYADNLTRLMRSPVFAMRRDGDLLAAALASNAPRPAPTAKTAAAPVGGIQRVSRGEVRIVTAPAQPAPVADRTPVRAATLDRFTPAVRIPLQPRASVAVPTARVGRMERVSRGEVRISGSLPVVGVRAATNAQGEIPGFTPAARISLAEPKTAEFRPQVRIELARPASRR